MAQPKRSEVQLRLQCPTCPPSTEIEENYHTGDMVCRGCGTVLGDRLIDQRGEWRTFASDPSGVADDPSRVGGPASSLLDRDLLETSISHRDGMTGLSRDLSRVQQKSNFRAEERNLQPNFRSIQTFSERIGLTQPIADRAKGIFKQADRAKVTRSGRMNEAVVAACIYIACRQEHVPRTFKEISSLCKVPKRDIGRAFKEVSAMLVASAVGLGDESEGARTMDANRGPGAGVGGPKVEGGALDGLVARFASQLGHPLEVTRLAQGILQRADSLGLATGKSPISIVSVAMYMACMLLAWTKHPASASLGRTSVKDLSAVVGIAENTIRGNFRDFFVKRREIVPEWFMSADAVQAVPEPNFLP